MRLLLLEDDAFLREGLTDLFSREGFEVMPAATLKQAQQLLSDRGTVDAAVLDVLLPDGSGVTFCRHLRAQGHRFPVLFLSACDQEEDIVHGLDEGGDDYLTKPFGTRELLSRVRALTRRQAPTRYESPGFEADLERQWVQVDGEPVFLTQTEFRVLSLMLKSGGRVVSREQLLRHIWDDGGQFVDDNTLSVHISRLREKIGAGRLRTVRGVGYRWTP